MLAKYTVLVWIDDLEDPPIVIGPFPNKRELELFKGLYFGKIKGDFKKMSQITSVSPEEALSDLDRRLAGKSTRGRRQETIEKPSSFIQVRHSSDD